MTSDGANDQPATAEGPCADETEIVPPVSKAATELAWSRDEDDTELIGPRPWRSAWAIAGMGVLCALVTATAIAAFGIGFGGSNDAPEATSSTPTTAAPLPAEALPSISTPVAVPPPTATVTVTPAPVPPPTVTVQAAPPPSAIPVNPQPAPPDSDRVFREGVAGIPDLHIVNWQVAEAGARGICGGFAHGLSRSQIVEDVQRNDPTFAPWQTSALVNVSLAAYCPQYAEN